MTASDVVNTLTISLSFVTVWSIIILLVASQSYREKANKKRNDIMKTHPIVPDGNDNSNINDSTSASSTTTGSRQTFLNIVISYFASDDDSLSKRINASKSNSTSTSTSTRNAFRNYIISYFPAIYQNDQSLQQLLVSILTHHQYFSLLSNRRNNIGIYHHRYY